MKRSIVIIAALLAGFAAQAQTAPEEFKARYDKHVRAVGACGVGVETIIDRWEEAFPDDPQVYEARSSFYLSKSASHSIITRDTKRYLGKEAVLSLKDSTGTDVYYFEDTVCEDSLFALSQTAIDRAINLEPNELEHRISKISALLLYEKESPDMTTQELLKLIDYQKYSSPDWTYKGLAVDEDTFKQSIQEYCYQLFQNATPGNYEAFKTVSEAMLKLYPKDSNYMNNLGSYWMVYRKNNKKALSWYKKALKVNPKDYSAAKNCVILARKEKNLRLEKKYLPMLIETTPSESERIACQVRLENLEKKKK